MKTVQARLVRRKVTVAAAESCTGGLLATILTAHGGASDHFRGGAVVYSNDAKEILADVAPQLIHSHGAVSSVVAGALARGSRARLSAKIGLGITRIAAVDPSAAMIARGRALPGGDEPRIHWILGRAEDAPLSPPYGLITVGASLHWMRPDEVLPRFRDALAPGAYLAVLDTETTH